jgi:lysophospholipase L1-like esterase
MKKWNMWTGVTTALATLWLLTGCEGDGDSYNDPATIGDNTPNTYLCIGDSLTYGHGLSTANSYPSQLAGMLQRTVINAGKSGERSWEGSARIQGVLARYKPTWCLIQYGANDIIYGQSQKIIPNLQAMVNICLANNTIPIVGTLTPAFGPHGYMADEIRNMNPRIRDWARGAGVRIADLDAAFNWQENGYYQGDGLHHSPDGAHLIAMTFFGQIDQDWGTESPVPTDETPEAARISNPTMEFMTR